MKLNSDWVRVVPNRFDDMENMLIPKRDRRKQIKKSAIILIYIYNFIKFVITNIK